MNLSVETQQEVIFLEDLCKIFLLSFTVSTCLKMRSRHPKISKFSGGACPRTLLAMPGAALPAGLPLAAKLAPPPPKKSCLQPCHDIRSHGATAPQCMCYVLSNFGNFYFFLICNCQELMSTMKGWSTSLTMCCRIASTKSFLWIWINLYGLSCKW